MESHHEEILLHLFVSRLSMTVRVSRALKSACRVVAGTMVVAVFAVSPGCMFAASARSTIAPPPSGLDAQNVVVPSASGSLIHAWFSRGRPGGGAVLLLHGVGANRTSMLGRAEFLHKAGFTVLAPDFQAHGESPGEYVTFGAKESLDAAATLAYLRTAVPGERVGVIGVSMGGAATLLGPGPIAVDAFVLESVYPTIRQAVSDRLGTWFGPLSGLGRLFTPAVIHFVGSEIGVNEAELQPIAHIATIGAPLLLISGTADQYTPIAEAESLYAHAPARKAFWAVAGAGHEDLYDFGRAAYEQRVGDFLVRNLR